MNTARLLLLSAFCLLAQPPAAPPKRAPGGGPNIPKFAETGFQPIFDGTSLNGWEGDPKFWKVVNGAITGETTADNPTQGNTFLVWQGGKPANFELKLEYRIRNHNSGVQYRSWKVEGPNNYTLRGYQADIDSANIHTGLLYEEKGRGFLAPRGQANTILTAAEGQRALPGNLASLGNPDDLKGAIRIDDWNEVHVIARGNMLVHIYNGRVFSFFLDEDTAGRAAEGVLGLQLHTGPPMKIEFRNLRLKQY